MVRKGVVIGLLAACCVLGGTVLFDWPPAEAYQCNESGCFCSCMNTGEQMCSGGQGMQWAITCCNGQGCPYCGCTQDIEYAEQSCTNRCEPM